MDTRIHWHASRMWHASGLLCELMTSTKNVVADTVCNASDLVNQFILYAKFLESRTEILNHRINVGII